ncbi:DinB family protein [Chryseobacterium sp. HR92]|uniref:DinB family protein n=1 Tax=Chryseobacterium sp. HR92 TaxID=3094839 RepID=UPI0038910828|nr:DinB family protein [Chryseobacterium sp. HR92]
MKRTELVATPDYFDRYINLVEDIDLFDAFDDSIHQIDMLDVDVLKKIGLKTYLPDKWTIPEILQHIADVERLLVSGTLRFVRGEGDYIISFDEIAMARHSRANARDVSRILNELKSVRFSTIELYKTFDDIDFQKSGINWKHLISADAMGFNIIGHQIHHLKFIEDHYYQFA